MDEPSQEPNPPAEPERPAAGESPLTFAVEAPRPTAGEPFALVESGVVQPGDALPAFPVEAPRLTEGESSAPVEPAVARPKDAVLVFPVEAPRPAAGKPFASVESDVAQPGDALPAFPVEAPRPAAEEFFAPVEPDVARPEDGLLAFPVEPPSPAQPSPPAQPPVPAQLSVGGGNPPTEPVPVAILPGSVGGVPPRPVPAETRQPIAGPPAPEPAAAPPRVLVPVLVTFGALLVLGACFLPLFRIEQHVTAQQTFFTPKLIFTETAWSSQVSAEGNEAVEQPAAPVGIPLVVAVAVLAAAAVFGFSRRGRLGHRLAVAGASFAAGIAATIGMSGFGWSSGLGDQGLEVSLGLGMWSLIAGVAVAVAAVVLGYLPAREPDDWSDPALAYADTPTPPTGFVAPTVDGPGVSITVLPPETPPEPPGR